VKERSTVTSELYFGIAGEGQPVVLLHPGFADSRIWDPQARLLADLIPGAQLERLPDTAHAPTIERPEAFDQLVTPFLAEVFGTDVVATTAEERAGIGSTAPST
jgi:pimeloyl-ACP methyl ester carboxylesterase